VHRYPRRFGGVGTIVTLRDGRAVTAAHCIAAADGTPGVLIDAVGRRFVMVVRWSPRRLDLAVLQAVNAHGHASAATRVVLRVGAQVVFYGHTGRRFQARRATVTAVTPTTAVATVDHPRGICGNDSGGPVFAAGVLAGVVAARRGPAVSATCSRQVVITRIDAPQVRARIDRACARWVARS
jgi:hypothetical protein